MYKEPRKQSQASSEGSTIVDVQFSGYKKDDGEEKDANMLSGLDPRARVIIQAQTNSPDVDVNFRTLFRYATKSDILLLAIGLIMACAAGSGLPLMTKVFGKLIDVFTQYQTRQMTKSVFEDNIRENTLYFVYLSLGIFVATYIYMSTWIYVGERQMRSIREHYLRGVLRQNIGWFDKLGAGEVTSRMTNDMALIQDGISEKVPMTANEVATFISSFCVAFSVNWKLTLALCSGVPLIAISILLLIRFLTLFHKKSLDIATVAGTLAEEVFSAIRTVTAFGSQAKITQVYETYADASKREGYKKHVAIAIGLGSVFLWVFLMFSLSFFLGAKLILNHETTSGKIVNVFMSVLFGSLALGSVGPNAQAFSMAISAGKKIFEAIDRVPPIDTERKGRKLPTVRGHIHLSNVHFRYPARSNVPVLKGLTLDIPAGQTVALVGASGSGKSTIIQLVERFYDPLVGYVYLDDMDIRGLDLQWLRRQIALVSQEPTLFNATIAENVAAGLVGTEWENRPHEMRMERIIEACKIANAHEFIMNLPQQYNTSVGERGLLLSGGQKQRIAIARAVVRDPKILLLDEATSALDTKSEKLVQQALDRASQGRTTIVVAHRLSTIRDADLIVVMHKGVIVEMGNHIELMKRGGAYVALVEAQRVNNEIDGEDEDEVPYCDVLPPEYFRSYKWGYNNEEAGNETMTDMLVRISRRISSFFVPALPPEPAPPLPKFDVNRYRANSARASYDTTPKGMAAHDLESTGELQHMPRQYTTWEIIKRVAQLTKPDSHLIAIGIFAATLNGGVYPAFSIAFSNILEVFTKPPDELRKGANFWSLMFVFIAMGNAIVFGIQAYTLGKASERLTKTIRVKSLQAILRQEIGWFDRDENASGVLTSRLTSDATMIEGLAGPTFGTIMESVSTVFCGLIVGLAVGHKMTLVVFTTVPMLLLAGYLRTALASAFQERAKKTSESSAQLACEATTAIRTVASLTRESQVLSQYRVALSNTEEMAKRNAFMTTLLYAFSQGANYLAYALAFWYGSQLFKDGEYDLRKMFTVFMAVVFGAQNAGRVFSYAKNMTQAKVAATAVLNLLDRKPEMVSGVGRKVTVTQGHILAKNVHFRYPTRVHQPILRGLSLEIQPGQFAALVGPSGSGKSTIIALLERFYDVTSGSVELDGVNVAMADIDSLREQIALVSQEPSLFDLTIRENILLGATRKHTQSEIEYACRQANIHDFIMSLPNGYDTKVGHKGTQLSGGQKQRIAIARALIRQPKVLLLDEATSALDSESEKVVQEALDAASKGRTTIAIAHRLSTIQHADVIFVIKNGVVVERGRHAELIEQRGLYYDMVREQDLGVDG
ncbi:uncharacterized protein VTP21DRAFT_6462 [Calcarisporiella thermophila]|uniref:uncharacterized protein n=1 Tax=Calcarisporiella thermophila TaxID=911321 RepID=UPI00374330D1